MKLSFNQRLKSACIEKNSRLCIGLDIDPDRFSMERDTSLEGMEAFGKEVIDGTIAWCPVYKPNFAFFERYGSKGYILLEKLVDHINGRAIVIADAKRGDINNTSRQYAKSILDNMGCDAVTISPYMGRDAIEPFLENAEKGVFILSVTSNLSACEIQGNDDDPNPLYQKVIKIAVELNQADNVGIIVGATRVSTMKNIRINSRGIPWLIPGVGFQGGDLENAAIISNQDDMGIISISRGILYAGDGTLNDIINAAEQFNSKIMQTLCTQVNC